MHLNAICLYQSQTINKKKQQVTDRRHHHNSQIKFRLQTILFLHQSNTYHNKK